MGVLDKLGGVAKGALSAGKDAAVSAIRENVTPGNVKNFAKAAASRLAKTAWDWSGASEIGILNDTANATSKAYTFLKEQRDANGDGLDDETNEPMRNTPRLPNSPSPKPKGKKNNKPTPRNNQSQGIRPRPLALPPPARPSNQEVKETRRVSAETRDKLRVASKANASQRDATRRASIEAQRGAATKNSQNEVLKEQLQIEEKSANTQLKIYDELEAIHKLMLRENNPLIRKAGGKAGEGGGGGLMGNLLGGLASRIPGLGGLLAGGKALGGKVLGKAAGLAAKIPGLGKLGKIAGMAIPGLAGMAIPGMGGFAGGADAASDVSVSDGKAAGKGGLAGKVGDVTDVVAKSETKVAGKAAGKGGLAGKVGDVTDVVAKSETKVAGKAAGKGIAKGLGKSLLKKIPLVGALAGIGFGISRAMKGDWTGAGMEVASGLAGTVPGLGTAASVGIDAALIAKDTMAEDGLATEEQKKDDSSKTGDVKTEAVPPVASRGGETAREPVAGPLVPTSQNAASAPGFLATSLSSERRPSSGAAESWRKPVEKTEDDVRVLDLLTTLASAMLDRDKGIFVKPAKDVFGDSEDPFSPAAKPGADSKDGMTPAVYKPESVRPAVPVASSESVKVAPIGGSGFTPNSERPDSPRPYLGGGAVPMPRQDISAATARDSSVAIKAPTGPTVGVKSAGKGFNGFGEDISAATARDSSVAIKAPTGPTVGVKSAGKGFNGFGEDVDGHIKEDVLRGFVKMEGGWKGATARDSSVAIKAPTGPTVGVKSAGKGFNGFGEDVDGHIKEASAKYGIKEDVLRGFVKMEGGWKGAMSPTGAIGTGQFIQSTWDGLSKTDEGKEIGMSKIGNRFRKEDDPRRDKRTNTMATGLLAKQNAEMLKKNGIEPTGENLYMMHNIGPGVMKAMKGEQVSEATTLAMKQNGMKDGMTPKDFVAYQKDRYNSHYAAANSPEVIAAAKTSGVKSAPVALASNDVVKPGGKTTPSVARPAVTPVETNAMALASSQRDANAAAVAPVVIAAGGGDNRKPRGSSSAAGDAKPDVIVRNNESSLARVTDNFISRTIT